MSIYQMVSLLILSLSVVFAGGLKNEDDFYKIHQAVGFLEAYVKEECPDGLNRAKNLSDEKVIESVQDMQLQKIKNEVRKSIFNSDKLSLIEIEKLRKRLHELQSKKMYPHQQRWHDEFRKCLHI